MAGSRLPGKTCAGALVLERLRGGVRQRREGSDAIALDCCDREPMSYVATTNGIGGDDVRDLMLAAVEHRFGRIDRARDPIEWLSDNGRCYIAHGTRRFARGLALKPSTTPVESRSRTAWRRPACARSSATTFASAHARTPKVSSGSFLIGSTAAGLFGGPAGSGSNSSSRSPVAICMTRTALPITPAGRLGRLGGDKLVLAGS